MGSTATRLGGTKHWNGPSRRATGERDTGWRSVMPCQRGAPEAPVDQAGDRLGSCVHHRVAEAFVEWDVARLDGEAGGGLPLVVPTSVDRPEQRAGRYRRIGGVHADQVEVQIRIRHRRSQPVLRQCPSRLRPLVAVPYLRAQLLWELSERSCQVDVGEDRLVAVE